MADTHDPETERWKAGFPAPAVCTHGCGKPIRWWDRIGWLTQGDGTSRRWHARCPHVFRPIDETPEAASYAQPGIEVCGCGRLFQNLNPDELVADRVARAARMSDPWSR